MKRFSTVVLACFCLFAVVGCSAQKASITKAEIETFMADKLAQQIVFQAGNDYYNGENFAVGKHDVENMFDGFIQIGINGDESGVSYEEFNEYSKKYFNKTYTDDEILKNAPEFDGKSNTIIGTVKDTKTLKTNGLGYNGEILSVDNVEIKDDETAIVTCTIKDSAGDEDFEKAEYTIKFAKTNSAIYFVNISLSKY